MLACVCYSLRLPLFPRPVLYCATCPRGLDSLTHIRGNGSECAAWSKLEDMNVCALSLCSGREVPGPLAPVALFCLIDYWNSTLCTEAILPLLGGICTQDQKPLIGFPVPVGDGCFLEV